ncbi:MAG: phosphoglucosamine mutase, partial [Clostridia bacterium]|nr:phosphoglucosamine mutase [Clostridia bacterium]
IFLNYNTTGDGLVSALNILKILKLSGKKLSELAKIYETMPQCIINAKVSNKKKYGYDKDGVILEEIKNLEAEFDGKGRVLVRASGTEPCVRVMIEGSNMDIIKQKAKYLASIIEARLS